MQTETTLHPEPLQEGLAWLAECGGPVISGLGQEGRISYRGVEWKWRHFPTGSSDFSSVFLDCNKVLTGWVSLNKAAKGGVFWRHVKVLSRTPRTDHLVHLGDALVTIAAQDWCATVDEAMDTALAWDFEAVELSNGDTLYRTGLKSWESIGTNRINIENVEGFSRDELKPWFWGCNCAEIAPLLAFCTSTSTRLEGNETSREQAIERAANAVDSFIAACRSVVAKHDADRLKAVRGETA